jgi:hypothetical protein
MGSNDRRIFPEAIQTLTAEQNKMERHTAESAIFEKWWTMSAESAATCGSGLHPGRRTAVPIHTVIL